MADVNGRSIVPARALGLTELEGVQLSWALECWLGRATFVNLVERRPVRLHTCYRFCRTHYTDVAVLWPSVRDVIRAWKGLMVFLVQVSSVGRVSGRSRFQLTDHSGRESAFGAADLVGDPRSGVWDTPGDEIDVFVVVPDFPESARAADPSCEPKPDAVGGRARGLARRSRQRLAKYLGAALGVEEDSLSLLEAMAISDNVCRYHSSHLQDFEALARELDPAVVDDDDVGGWLVKFFDDSVLRGRQPDCGGKVLAAFADRHPACSKAGKRRVPRAWRCLRMWRRPVPGRSRRPPPRAVWKAMAADVCSRRRGLTAVAIMHGVGACHRPRELKGQCLGDSISGEGGVARAGWRLGAPARTWEVREGAAGDLAHAEKPLAGNACLTSCRNLAMYLRARWRVLPYVVAQAARGSPWAALGLRRGAPRSEVKRRFKLLAASEHPDKHPGDAAAEQRFKVITAAYEEVLAELSGGRPAAAPTPARPRSSADRVRDAESKWRKLGVDPQDARAVRDALANFSRAR
ncbi:unnamed protein product [Prorocentrum cordatum]|uniref:J domain-containing protein n=1 Tax=Prorocentrum cordatum TaxID=2364126 RepID=A0ABN9YB93_9DINO|nr:unnamed protein product [Polarella glacialis]